MDENNTNDSLGGRLIISKKAVKKMIQECILEIDGIKELASLPLNIKNFILKAKRSEPISISIVDGTVYIKIGIVIKNGVNVLAICKRCQKQLKETIQSMTGFTVSKIDIYVIDMAIQDKESA